MVPSSKSSDGSPNRRAFLKATGASSLVAFTGLAGCLGGDGGGDGDGGGGGDGGDGGTATGTPGGEDPVKVGVLIPLSGPLSVVADAMTKGAEVTINHLNDDLGGINGRSVESITEDTQTDPAAGREAARKLVESDGVDLLLGALSGAVNLSISDYAYGARVPYWGVGGAESHTGADCVPTSFLYQFSASMDARAGLGYCLDNFGTNVWIHYADYSFGQSISETWQQEMEEHERDVNVINVTNTPLGTSDFSSFISQMQASDADWVLSGVTGSDAVNFMKQSAEFGLKDEKDIMNPITYQQPVRQGAGQAVIGTHTLIRYFYGYDTPENQDFVNRFTDAYNEPPTDFASVLWSSARLHAQAAENAGTLEVGPVVSELEGMQSDEPMGPVTMRACDHQGVRDYPVGEIVPPTNYDWPDMEVRTVRPGDEIIEPCDETNCDMPSL